MTHGLPRRAEKSDGAWLIKTSTLTRLREDVFNGLVAVYISPRIRAVSGRIAKRLMT